jgi:hypothetical protein
LATANALAGFALALEITALPLSDPIVDENGRYVLLLHRQVTWN